MIASAAARFRLLLEAVCSGISNPGAQNFHEPEKSKIPKAPKPQAHQNPKSKPAVPEHLKEIDFKGLSLGPRYPNSSLFCESHPFGSRVSGFGVFLKCRGPLDVAFQAAQPPKTQYPNDPIPQRSTQDSQRASVGRTGFCRIVELYGELKGRCFCLTIQVVRL